MLKFCTPLLLAVIAASAQTTVSVPKVAPSNAARIFGAAKDNLEPVDGSLTVKGADNQYTTRIVVRRPAQAARFSGTVIVEFRSRRSRRLKPGGYFEVRDNHVRVLADSVS